MPDLPPPPKQEEPPAQEEIDPAQEEIDPAQMEHEVNATTTVQPVDFHGKLPDDFEKDALQGKFHNIIGWSDTSGVKAIVFGISAKKQGDGSVSSLLVADVVAREGDAWTSQRKFKVSVDSCSSDTVLQAITGPWSVSDLDHNGNAEASFALNIGCRSDESPVVHKVFVVAFDDDAYVQKYVLRGHTTVGPAQKPSDATADPAFDKVPKSYLDHATKIWEMTSVEKSN